ncbi:MAG: hypothetical protein AAFV98_04275, partial [Chloroflexota bacterium]
IEGKGRDPLGHRYIGSMVGDFHRNLLKGGIFLYPGDTRPREDAFAGKIRLMFEAQSLAFIMEQAGGYASDGIGNILDVRPHSLHQRIPIFMGNRDLVEKLEYYVKTYDKEWVETYLPYRNMVIEQESTKALEVDEPIG